MKFTKKVIDSHMHIKTSGNRWFDKEGKTYIELLDQMQKAKGLENVNILALCDEIYGGVETNIMAAIYKLHNPTAYAYADLVFPTYPVSLPFPSGFDAETQYEELMEIGFDGFKILQKPDLEKIKKFTVDNEYYNEFFALAERDNTHIIWHVADPEQNWLPGAIEGPWGYSDGTYPTWQEHYDQVFRVLERHPKLNATFAHFFFLEEKPEELADIFEKYENVGVDVVPGLMFSIFMKKPEFYREFLTKYADRIIYGSDWAVLQDSNEFGEALMDSIYDSLTTEKESNIWGNIVKGIALPDEVTDKILYKNFKRKCHNEPKPINKKALKAYIEKYKDYIRDLESKEQILKFAETL